MTKAKAPQDLDALSEDEAALEEIYQEALRLRNKRFEELQMNQNLPFGALGGFVGAIVGALLWAAITYFTKYQIGYMAIGVGALVGFAIQFTGRGVDKIFGITGALLALFGTALGNILYAIAYASAVNGIGLMDLVTQMQPSDFISILSSGFNLYDLLFYGLAVYCGYNFATVSVEVKDFLPEGVEAEEE